MTRGYGVVDTNDMTTLQDAKPRRKCEALSLEDADDIFFPSTPGKKPTRAKALCATCPFESVCLLEALENDLKGFYAGTTEPERKVMAKMRGIVQKSIDDLIPEPEKPTAAKPKYLKVVVSPEFHAWMDEVEPSEDELLEVS